MTPHDSSTPPDVRLSVLDTGLIECADFALFSPNAGPAVRRDMSVRSYLVVHPRGTLVWDTGIADAIADLPDGQRIAEPIVFKVPRTLRSQLDELGVDPGTVDYLGLSHLHVDHVGNLDLFPNATVLLQEAEYAAGFGPDAEALTLIPETYAALNRDHVRAISGDHDLFGDGTVVLTALPGHTPGHQGLLVTLPDAGPILLATDIAYSAEDYAVSAVRPSNTDLEASRRSLEKAHALERERGATVWLHHDRAAQAAVRTAPSFYR
ncbi:N-acyl homoserine lactonase AttM [Baekduia alba]|uniref:N-acyl homoserine lactonase family protein n=1 Tax=Baekduia alba TaxID=2997333 RepID=UPI0023415CC9|nr:N-acyl homoserine lactonase family protein [Baekduia alba]WCB93401.1 N-acyl homoserine lactonase AttM [Baekduia alba]